MEPIANDGLGRRSFSVVRTLGEGAFGSVFLADMVSAGGFRRRVALKLLNSTWDPESDAGRRLRDEARLLGRLQHRNIVRVDDLLQLGGRWALLMEYIAGLDVETLISRARATGVQLPPRAMLQICAATAAAMDAAFAAVGDDGTPLQVVHRDIKPSNVRLSETGEVKVLDFGVARADFVGREAKTERVRYGSLGYMAPERVLGEPETAAGDVYALGVMLYELLTLESYGRAELGPDKQIAQVRVAVALVTEVVGDGTEIPELLARALDYDGASRPTAREMEVALRRAAGKLQGDDVQDFAVARFGGLALDPAAATDPDPAEGMVLEEGTAALQMLRTTASAAPPTVAMRPMSQSPTLAVPEPLHEIEATAAVPVRSNRGPVAAGVGVVIVLLLAVLAWRLGAPAPHPVTDPVASAPANPAVSAPAPIASTTTPASAPTIAPPSPAPLTTSVPQPPAVEPPHPASPRPLPDHSTLPAAPAVTQALPASSAPVNRLRAAKFVLTGAEGITVTCGDVTATGATNALVRDFPAGPCTVTAGGHKATVSLDAPGQINCTLAGDSLACP